MNASLTLGPLKPHRTRLRLLPHAGEGWLPLCLSSELLQSAPRPAMLAGDPIVLFRDGAGAPVALRDRCPHRGVKLSGGTCEGGAVVCPYHGLRVYGAAGAEEMGLEIYAAAERYGVVWGFLGPAHRSTLYAIPDFPPFGDSDRVDTILRMDMATHWSLILDNGVDLTHDHLHRDRLFFFRAGQLQGVKTTERGDIEVTYLGTRRDEFNRLHEGPIQLRISDHIVRLDFGGQPIIYSAITPRSADGLQVTQWWFISFRYIPGLRLLYQMGLSFVRGVMMRAFEEDRQMLEEEAAAVFGEGFQQRERNPMVPQVSALLEQIATDRMREHLPEAELASFSTEDVLREVRQGVLAVCHPTLPSPLYPEELAELLSDRPTVQLRRYKQMALLIP